MNWDAIGAVAEILGAIGVIASLFYLAGQIRRNSESVEAGTVQALSGATQNRLLAVAQSTGLAESFAKAMSGGDLSPAERAQLSFFTRASVREVENSFVQYRRGMIPVEVWRGYESLLRINLRGGVVEEWWSIEGATFDPEFRALVEEMLKEHAAA